MFTDVYFTPILVNDLIDVIFAIVETGVAGTYHVAGADRLSKYDFAMRVATAFGHPSPDVQASSVEGFPFKAARPRDMSLDCRAVVHAIGRSVPGIDDGLARLKSLQGARWPLMLRAAALAGRNEA